MKVFNRFSTVRELIAILETAPPDAKVGVYSFEDEKEADEVVCLEYDDGTPTRILIQ